MSKPALSPPVVRVAHLDFRYDPALPCALRDVDLTLAPGQRMLLIGANGAGKTTLLRILGGHHMVPEATVRVLGRPAFHDTSLAAEVSFIGGPFPVTMDVLVSDMMRHRGEQDPTRRQRLMDTLGVDPTWRMHRVSDGQRRRVQILLHLLEPKRLLLLDEVTTDLDVLVRADLLGWLKQDCVEHGTAILYATHIFDGLEDWATHLAAMEAGRVKRVDPLVQLTELQVLRSQDLSSPLYHLVEHWLRQGVPEPAQSE